MSPHALVPAEPGGDRPAVFDAFGDVWQRQGPLGSATWWCTQPGAEFDRGRSWPEVWVLFGELTLIERPELPDLAYTTDSIPVVKL